MNEAAEIEYVHTPEDGATIASPEFQAWWARLQAIFASYDWLPADEGSYLDGFRDGNTPEEEWDIHLSYCDGD